MALDIITKITFFPSTLGNSVGYGQITICDALSFTYNLNKKTSGEGLYLSLPSAKKSDGTEKKFVTPSSAEVYEYLLVEVLKAKKHAEEALKSTNVSSQTIETSGKRSFATLNSDISSLGSVDDKVNMVDI